MAFGAQELSNYKLQQENKSLKSTAQDQRNAQAGSLLLGNPSGHVLSGTAQEQEGQLAGLNLGTIGYGQGLSQTGQDIQRVRELQRQRTGQSGGDPVSAAIMGQKASAVANAQRNMQASGIKGGVAAQAADAVGRSRDADIAASLYGQQRQSIADERSLAGNTLAGQTSLMQGEKAANVKAPSAPDAGGMSVICTELFKQGYMPLDIYLKDSAYGLFLGRNKPEIIVGYHFLAKPVVSLMKMSPIFTKFISYPVKEWTDQICGNGSMIGLTIKVIGEPICGIVGKIKMKLTGEKYVPFVHN